MKLTNVIAAAALALLPLTAGAATLIIPAAGTGPGFHGTRWQSEVTLHNTSASAITAALRFHDQNGAAESASITVPARSTVSVGDIVATKFGRQSGTGAIEIVIDDADASRVTVSSRTSNVTDHGELGQDIAVVNVADAAKAGDMMVITGPSDSVAFRFNFGVYAASDAIVHWQLLRADGTVAASTDVTYRGGEQHQYNNGVNTLFNATPANNDAIHASMTTGAAIFYGSAIDQTSDDPTFVPAVRSREDIRINFTGVDRDGNGTVDVTDANHDGVLDGPITSNTLGFPAFFRIVIATEGGLKPTFEILSSPADARFIDADGTVQLVASGGLAGKSGDMKVRVTVGDQSSIVTIPLKFQ